MQTNENVCFVNCGKSLNICANMKCYYSLKNVQTGRFIYYVCWEYRIILESAKSKMQAFLEQKV